MNSNNVPFDGYEIASANYRSRQGNDPSIYADETRRVTKFFIHPLDEIHGHAFDEDEEEHCNHRSFTCPLITHGIFDSMGLDGNYRLIYVSKEMLNMCNHLQIHIMKRPQSISEISDRHMDLLIKAFTSHPGWHVTIEGYQPITRVFGQPVPNSREST